MPSRPEIQDEVRRLVKSGERQAPRIVLKNYLKRLHQHTGRSTILYATNWMLERPRMDNAVMITKRDLYRFMNATRQLKTEKLDLILHSSGGSAEATEAIVSYVRSKFKDVRVIIPYAAMSAATMLACSSDCLVMGKHSSLGPTDPQIVFSTSNGMRSTSVQSLINEFQKAQEVSEIHTGRLPAWLPLLRQYTPGLIQTCISSQKLSVELVQKWLADYMFAGESDAVEKSKKISETLSSSKKFHSHGRHISREECKAIGLKVSDLEDDQEFQDLTLSVFHAADIVFELTPIIKVVINHLGGGAVRASLTPQ